MFPVALIPFPSIARADSRFAPSQSNAVSHWQGVNLESVLKYLINPGVCDRCAMKLVLELHAVVCILQALFTDNV